MASKSFRLRAKLFGLPIAKFRGIEITNPKTCSTKRVKAVEDKALEKIEMPDGSNLDLSKQVGSLAGFSGALKLRVSDSRVRIGWPTNIADGDNVLEIKYFGKCLKYREGETEKRDDVYSCLEAEELGTKSVLIQLKVKRSEIDGVRQIKDNCSDK